MKKVTAVILVVVLLTMTLTSPSLASPSAGLYWGPTNVGNLKLYLTNAHFGYAGPKVGHVNHTNFHVDRLSGHGFVPVANFHITKYQRGSTNCTYVWDSESRRVIFDACNDTWRQVASQAAEAMRDFVRTLVDNSDWLAFLIIVGVLMAVLIILIISLPVVVLAEEPGSPIPALPATPPAAQEDVERLPIQPAPRR